MPTTYSIFSSTKATTSGDSTHFRVSRFAFRVSSPAFTLTELMVSITILVVIILSVGVIFGNASRAVGTSQSLMEMLSNVRAVQQVVERDVAGIDKNSFLVIRSRYLDFGAQNQLYRFDSVTGLTTRDPTLSLQPGTGYRFDQVSFVSLGAFPNRTGSADPLSPFSDTTIANAAHVWVGQMILERNSPPDNSYATPDQSRSMVPFQSAPPTGLIDPVLGTLRENEFTLGIHHTLMLPGPADASSKIVPSGISIYAHQNILLGGVNNPSIIITGEPIRADITSSRIAVAAVTPSQFMTQLTTLAGGNLPPANSSWDQLCYRFRSLYSVSDNADVGTFVNACFRMHPTALQGTSSFHVDWSDGTFLGGNQVWYSGLNPAADPTVNVVDSTGATLNGDNYIAVFSPNNRARWPKALRFTYHVVDPNKRLQGGRDFVQIVNLPD